MWGRSYTLLYSCEGQCNAYNSLISQIGTFLHDEKIKIRIFYDKSLTFSSSLLLMEIWFTGNAFIRVII